MIDCFHPPTKISWMKPWNGWQNSNMVLIYKYRIFVSDVEPLNCLFAKWRVYPGEVNDTLEALQPMSSSAKHYLNFSIHSSHLLPGVTHPMSRHRALEATANSLSKFLLPGCTACAVWGESAMHFTSHTATDTSTRRRSSVWTRSQMSGESLLVSLNMTLMHQVKICRSYWKLNHHEISQTVCSSFA